MKIYICILVLLSIFYLGCTSAVLDIVNKNEHVLEERDRYLRLIHHTNEIRQMDGKFPLNVCVEMWYYDAVWAKECVECKTVVDSLNTLKPYGKLPKWGK